MKRFLHCLLALALVLALAVPVIAVLPENAAAAGEQITLKYLNPAYFKIADDAAARIFTGGDNVTEYDYKTIDASQMSTYYNEGPEIEGWEFVGWYTAPVQYYFWGDYEIMKDSNPVEIPDAFRKDCNGKQYDYDQREDDSLVAGGTIKSYWRWLSSLNGTGHIVDKDHELDGANTLYALYKPKEITYYINFNGWGTAIGTLTCVREYGTPFGLNERSDWDGNTFDGWFDGNDDESTELKFYDVPESGKTYYIHWHREGSIVNYKNYHIYGTEDTTGIRLYDKPNSGNPISNITVTSCSDWTLVKVYAKVLPEGNGVTNLEWKVTKDDNLITVAGDGLSATITPKTGALKDMEKATATVTVTAKRADNTTYSQDLTVNVQAHAFGKSTIRQFGNCGDKATIITHECSYCHEIKTKQEFAKHVTAIRFIPATCTTPRLEEHYCKNCGAVVKTIVRGDAKGHNYTTTTTTGCGGTVTTKTCQTCGHIETDSNASGALHKWSSESTIDVIPTCAKDGSRSHKCLECGATEPGSSKIIPANTIPHQWSDWTDRPDKESDIDYQYRRCSVCGVEEERVALAGFVVEEQNDKIKAQLDITAATENTDREAAKKMVKTTIESLLWGNGSLAYDIRYASLTNPNKAITADIVVTPVTETAARDIKANLGSDATASYVDIDIIVKSGDQNIGRITQTNDEIAFKLPLPRPKAEGEYVTVLRSHNGKIDVVKSTVEEGNYVSFKSNMFSTFAVSVSDTPYTPPATSGGGGGGGGGGAASTATVSVSKSLQNGSIQVNDTEAKAGDTVKVTPQAEAGYLVDQVTVTDKNGKAIEVKKNSDGTYSFVMPEEALLPVTVTATFKVDPAAGGPAAKFTDVVRDAWYSEGINFVLEHNLMQGVSADTFAPNATTTRGMIVTILYRLAGEPATTAGAFTDVAAGAWYADAIGWAAANGIVEGFSATQFAPNEPVTREQLAAILYRYEQKFGNGGFTGDWSYQLPFEDTAKVSDWAYEAMAWCNMNGVIDGMTDKTLEPAGNATRAQIATILMRFAADDAE